MSENSWNPDVDGQGGQLLRERVNALQSSQSAMTDPGPVPSAQLSARQQRILQWVYAQWEGISADEILNDNALIFKLACALANREGR